MVQQIHSRNKYKQHSVQKSAVVPFPKPKKFLPLRVEVKPGSIHTLDLSFLSKRPQLEQFFYEIIDLIGKSVSGVTVVKQYPWILKKLSDFLDDLEIGNERQILTTHDIDSYLLVNFRIWLEVTPKLENPKTFNKNSTARTPNKNGTPLNNKSINNIYSGVVYLLKKGRNYKPELFPNLTGPLPKPVRINVHTVNSQDIPTVEDIKKLLLLCRTICSKIKAEYETVRESLERTKSMPIRSLDEMKPVGYWKDFDNYVHSIVRENGISKAIPSKIISAASLYGHPNAKSILKAYVPVQEDSLLPFALQLYITTALNVSSLNTLKRDCIEDFSIPKFKKLNYDKPRAGKSRYKSHLIPSHKSTSRSEDTPLDIINFISEWTQPLAEQAPDEIKDCLFLYRAANAESDSERIKNIKWNHAYTDALKRFFCIYEKEVKKFRLVDLRPAVASLLYLRTKDVFKVQAFLGHEHIKTTINYIRGHVINRQFDEKVTDGINSMIGIIENSKKSVSAPTNAISDIAEIIHDDSEMVTDAPDFSEDENQEYGVMTLTSRCRNPLSPPSSLSVPKGKMCTEIYKCFSCENSVILLTDLPVLLKRTAEIWNKRSLMPEESWEILFKDAWLALNQTINKFSDDQIEAAKERLKPSV